METKPENSGKAEIEAAQGELEKAGRDAKERQQELEAEFKKKRDMLVKKNNGNKKIKKSNKNNQKPIIKSK